MILVAGIPDEGPTASVIEALDEIGAAYAVFDQRRHAEAEITLEIGSDGQGGSIGGVLAMPDASIPLDQLSGFFVRTMDDTLLPGVSGLDPTAPAARACRSLHDLLVQFADFAPCRVLNRPADMGSNFSKPYQAHAIRDVGFDVPETLITNDPAAARDYIEAVRADGGAVIYKSISGVRSIVQTVTEADLARLDRIRWCPTQFQRQVLGVDIRVHVVGQSAFAAEIVSDAADYRYAMRQVGAEPEFRAIELDRETHARCIALSARLGLPLAGIDLRRTPEGRYFCFEANPSPAFSYYEAKAGLPIGAAIARYLAGDAD